MYDTRLLGFWRSDGARTRKELAARRDIPPQARLFLGKLFGKLELRFTRTRCYTRLKGHTGSASYTVLAKDSSSVATMSEDVISHFHFEGSHFWIHVGKGTFREFFKRVTPPKKTRSASRARPLLRTSSLK
jgi:hypothetical protein